MCLHFDGATPTEWKEQGRSPIFLKNSQVHSFFLFVFQFQITIYSRNCLFLIYTKWLWFKPKQTEKAELPNWLILKVIQKPDLFVPPRENPLLKSEDHNVQFIHDEDAICVINKHKSSSVTPSYCSREPIDHNHGVSKKELGISGKL